MPVDTQHQCIGTLQPKREAYQSVKGGTDAIWAGDETYLPKYPGELDSEYKSRKKMSTIDGLVAGGVDSLCGAVFYGEIETDEVGPQIIPFLENIDNEGNSFDIFARRAFEESFDGYSLIIVDQPKTDAAITSLEDKQRAGIRPYWRLYTAANIWNWRYRVNPKTQAKQLSLLVLREQTEEMKDEFESEIVTRFRVYAFDANSNVTVRVFEETGKNKAKKYAQVGDTITLPFFSAIPAAIIGELGDEPKLLVESRLEILGYQKESSFNIIEYLSVPSLYTKGWQPTQPNERLALGAAAHIQLPADANAEAGFITIDSSGHASLKETIATIKDTIKTRVNYLVDSAVKQGAAKTATEVTTSEQNKQSRLIVWAMQLKDALELALMFTGEAMGLGSDAAGEIELKTRWDSDSPAMQLEELAVLEKEKDVLNLPDDVVRQRYGMSQEEIDAINKQNELMVDDSSDPNVNDPNPNDSGTN